MSLVQDLRNDILDPKISLSSTLRRAKVLASTLRNDEFKKWVDNELNGYHGADEEKIPDYRRSRAENRGHFLGFFGRSINNAPIPTLSLPEPIKEFAREILLVEGVRSLESLIESDSPDFSIPWPADTVAVVSNKIFESYTCITAWKSVSRGQVEQVLDTVRNRLLNFVLELQERYPEISKSEDAISDIPRDQVAPIVNTYIFGDYNIVASGSDIDQRVHQKALKNDLDALLAHMKEIGVPADDAKELKKAIEGDGARTEPNTFGSKVTGWVGKMTMKIVEGTWKVAISSAPTLIVKALCRYYGWQ